MVKLTGRVVKAIFNVGKNLIFCSLVRAYRRAVVVVQLVEQSLPIPEIHGLNPVISKNLYVY